MTKHYSRAFDGREALEQALARAHKWLWLAQSHADRTCRQGTAEDLAALAAAVAQLQADVSGPPTAGVVSPAESRAARRARAAAAAVDEALHGVGVRQRPETNGGSKLRGPQ